MSKGPENTFIGSVHKHLPSEVYRMKNHNQYNGGIPDCWYSGRQADLWIEYKFLVLPKRETTLIEPGVLLSALQREWLEDRHAEGRNVGVVIGSKDGGMWYPGTTWKHPHLPDYFKRHMQTRQQLAKLIYSLTETFH